MTSPTKRSLERLDEIAFKAGDDGLELYAESWRKAKKKGDVGLPVREALKIEIRKALDQAREEQRERDANLICPHKHTIKTRHMFCCAHAQAIRQMKGKR